MNQLAEDAITEMLNGFSQTKQDYQVLLSTLEKLCAGIDDRAIIAAAMCFADGQVPGQSKSYPPTSALFMDEVRRQADYLRNLAHPRLPPPIRRNGTLSPFEVKKQKALTENANRPVLFEDVNFDKWKLLSAQKSVQIGAIWVATLGIVFGPEPK